MPGVDESARDLTQLSWGAFGARRGIRRILELLGDLEISATIFVPGWTVEKYPERVREIAERGHEVGHHGFHHVPPVQLDADAQREDLERGIAAIERCTGSRPLGYRSPSWQLTPVTFELLVELGFVYDSSCMGDDRPYLERHHDLQLIELPVHWTLNDFPQLATTSYTTSPLRDPADIITIWRREIGLAIDADRSVVLTCHPEVVGRAGPMQCFGEFVRELRDNPRLQLVRCIELADRFSG